MLRHARLLPACALVLAPAACGGDTQAASTTTVTVDMTTTVARPGGAPASPGGSPSASRTGDTGGPLPPLTTFALPTGLVHREDAPSAFVSRAGTTQCLVTAQGAFCERHSGWNLGPAGDRPSPPGYCPGGGEVTGVVVGENGNAWRCGTPDVASPGRGSAQAAWAPPRAETKEVGGAQLVVLPYGEAIVVGDYRCLDLESGVECRRLSTQDGFKMTRWGVHWSGSRPSATSPY